MNIYNTLLPYRHKRNEFKGKAILGTGPQRKTPFKEAKPPHKGGT